VKRLRPLETVEVDRERLDHLYLKLGRAGADSVVARAMEELAVRLGKVDSCYREGELDEVSRAARSMIAISEQIGMVTFALVASSVQALVARDDGAALAAAIERLIRTGENSLLAVWELQGASL
jgi:hypothetical protein